MTLTVDAAAAAASGLQSGRCAAGYGRYASSTGKLNALRVVRSLSAIVIY